MPRPRCWRPVPMRMRAASAALPGDNPGSSMHPRHRALQQPLQAARPPRLRAAHPHVARLLAALGDGHGRAVGHVLERLVGGVVQGLADVVLPGVVGHLAGVLGLRGATGREGKWRREICPSKRHLVRRSGARPEDAARHRHQWRLRCSLTALSQMLGPMGSSCGPAMDGCWRALALHECG